MKVEEAPVFGESENSEIVEFIDQYVSCSSKVVDSEQIFKGQMHKHSKTCRKYGKAICRFGYPIPPMPRTMILMPLDDTENTADEEIDSDTDAKRLNRIETMLVDNKDGIKLSFKKFLRKLNMSESQYIKAIRSSMKDVKIYLKRDPCDIRVNAYCKQLLSAWKANHDLQFILDPYACAMYIVNYINKSQKGMSALLDRACKEAREGNMDIKQSVRHIGNMFLNNNNDE